MCRCLILLSTYNGEKYLPELLESVLAQKDIYVDILARDDGSTDKTVEILKKYDRVKVYGGNNLKPAKSFLDLIWKADINYDYYALCDQDDVWKEEKIISAVKCIENIDKALMTTLAFAQYSFAVSMENFMNVAVTPVTTTLYNYFCKATDKSQIRKTRNYVMVFAAAIVSCAFPARFILEIYLTKYIDSAKVMFLLFAAQIFYIVIKSVYVNLYKAQKKQNIYFIKLQQNVLRM